MWHRLKKDPEQGVQLKDCTACLQGLGVGECAVLLLGYLLDSRAKPKWDLQDVQAKQQALLQVSSIKVIGKR